MNTLILATALAVLGPEGQKVCDIEFPETVGTIETTNMTDAVAWRIRYSEPYEIANEEASYIFEKDWRCWPTSHAQGEYVPRTITTMSDIAPMPAQALVAAGIGEMRNYATAYPGSSEGPLLVEGDGWAAVIGEVGNLDYARVRYLPAGDGTCTVKTLLEGGAKIKEPRATPWRYIRTAKSAAALAESQNAFMAALSCPSRISDRSWIRPGKVLRVARLDEETGRAAVDFVKRNNMQYIELDAGWYGQEHTGDPLKPKDYVRPVIDYATSQGVGTILYVNREPLKKNRDEILDTLVSWGVKGVKYGFVNVGSQEWREWVLDAIKAAADRKLLVDIHDEYRLAGVEHTYPNVMTVEGIRGNEEMPNAAHDCALPFTRYLDGPGDYTPCWTVGRVKNTLAHQLATPCVYTSGFQFLFWYQRPEQIKEKDPALDFWREIPCAFDETKILEGETGRYIVMARRSGAKWFVGGLNGLERRTFKVKLDFAGSGEFDVRIFRDADPALAEGLGKVQVEKKRMKAGETIEVEAAARGGFALIVESAPDPERALDRATSQYKILLERFNPTVNTFPRSWTRGIYKSEPDIGWTTGFFPGSLWYIYAMRGGDDWKTAAVDWTRRLYGAKDYRENHDLGFMFYCSYGNAMRFAPGAIPEANGVIDDASRALLSRYIPALGVIRSWDEPRFMRCPVIIDSMMNLEMLTDTRPDGTKPPKENFAIAKSHADNILATQYRPDGSVYHVTDWNPETGRIYARYAWQGACVDGAWARGQAWSVYGFTVMYRVTREKRYLEQAKRSADWVIAHAPADAIPFWDYKEANTPGAPRDASAAAVTASALLELESYAPGRGYRTFASRILSSLCNDEYLAAQGDCGGFLLKHSTGHLPEKTEIDASINYADYYFLEALYRLANPNRELRNFEHWPDSNGVHINAHGGGIIREGGKWWWFGEHKIAGKEGNKAHVGVHAYSSNDLHTWHDEGVVLSVTSGPGDIEDGCILERPKVAKAKNGKFVMYFHLERKGKGYNDARTGIAASDTIAGPYKFIRSERPNAKSWPRDIPEDERTPETLKKYSTIEQPWGGLAKLWGEHFNGGQMARDMTLFTDTDGSLYHFFASEDNSCLHVAKLTDDGLDYTGEWARVSPGHWTEAPCVFEKDGWYYLLGSYCTGWRPNDARYYRARSVWGPWERIGNPTTGVNPLNKLGPQLTWGGQSACIFKNGDAVWAMFDLWKPDNAIDGRYAILPVLVSENHTIEIPWKETF